MDITIISAAFVVIIGAMFSGFLKLMFETRKILNGASEKRSVTAEKRHGEVMHELKTMLIEMKRSSESLKAFLSKLA